MKESGFTIVELITVIAIMAILIAISTMDFHKWSVKSNVEKETREMYADFCGLRTRAMYTGKRHRISLYPKGYTFRSYTTSEPLTAGTVVESKGLPYEITMEDGSSVSGQPPIDFDTRGFITSWGARSALRINAPASDAALNCLVISTGQTNIGKMKNDKCVAK
jgi:prepilin-type N-terminal cleavage/methylation domain-containing protein